MAYRIPVPNQRQAPAASFGSAATAHVGQPRYVTPPQQQYHQPAPAQYHAYPPQQQQAVREHRGGPMEPTVHVYHSHSQELQALQSELGAVKTEMDRHREFAAPALIRTREEQLEDQLNEARNLLRQKDDEIARISGQLSETNAKFSSSDKSMEEKDKLIETLQAGNETMRQKQSEFLDSVNAQVHTFEQEFEAKNARISELLTENKNLHADFDDAMDKLKKAELHIEQQLEEVEVEKEQVLELMEEVLQLRTNSKSLHIAIDTIKNTHDKETKHFQEELEKYKRAQDNKDVNAITLNAEIADLRDQLAQRQREHDDMIEARNREQAWGESKNTVDDEMIVKERLQAAREKRDLEAHIKELKKEIHVLTAVPAVPEVTFRALREHQKDQAVNQNRKDEMKILRLQQEVES